MAQINFGILDPSLPQQYAQPFARGEQNRLALQQAQQAQQASQQANALNALRLQQAQQQMADENAMRNLYSQSGGDINKVVEGLTQQGQYKPAMELQSQMASQQIAARKAKVEEAMQHLDFMGRLSSGIKDQQTYDAAKQQMASVFGPDSVANIPAQYDPSVVTNFRNQALSAKDQAEQQWKALDYALKNQQFGFEQQKFGAQQGLERAKMGQAERHFQAQQGLEREKFQAGQVEKVGTPAQRKQDATDAIAIVQQAAPLIDIATSSGAGNIADITAGFVGKSTPGANAAAQLKVLGGALVSKMPKMSGPQSDKDVLLYKEMAGRIGDPTVPREQKKAAMQTIMELQSKYAGVEPPKLDFSGKGAASSHPAEIQDLLNKYGG